MAIHGQNLKIPTPKNLVASKTYMANEFHMSDFKKISHTGVIPGGK